MEKNTGMFFKFIYLTTDDKAHTLERPDKVLTQTAKKAYN